MLESHFNFSMCIINSNNIFSGFMWFVITPIHENTRAFNAEILRAAMKCHWLEECRGHEMETISHLWKLNTIAELRTKSSVQKRRTDKEGAMRRTR